MLVDCLVWTSRQVLTLLTQQHLRSAGCASSNQHDEASSCYVAYFATGLAKRAFASLHAFVSVFE